MNTQAEMPKYKCHKEVHALKIAAIELDSTKAKAENRETDGSAIITPADSGYSPFLVDQAYVNKHKPEVGGYYVVYSDGYKSFSPAKAFEDGYTRVVEHRHQRPAMTRTERGAPVRLNGVVGRFIQWWRSRKIDKAIRESNQRMNNLTVEERRELGRKAREIIYPNGYWTCRNHGEAVAYNVPAGEACPICKSANKHICDASQMPVSDK